MSWKDIKPREDILRPTLEFIGGPKRLGAASALVSAPILYWLSKRVASSNRLPDAKRRAAIVSGIMSPLLGYGVYAMSKNVTGEPLNNKEFANSLIGSSDEGWTHKFSSDWSDALNTPFSKGVLMQGVDELDATPSQKNFLNNGIKFAPGNSSTTLWGLGDGFGQAVDTYTGSMLGHAARAIEGAIIGGSFGALMGLSPTNRKWAAGIGAVADSLKGSEFYNALGHVY